ncbi:hypothetical protein [Algoriphagus resistens]|uniref:hypothetical protein n=1 Tax=Algoriphagus resistens TaxID=1750590 RepID=UPI000716B48A|nr:hypothetical protein [Algoriphagus resistens]
MKKAKSILAFGLLVVLLNSCVFSLFPIYTEDTLVYIPELIGRWDREGHEEYIEFINFPGDGESPDLTKAKNYHVVIMEGSERQDFVGHIAEIGKDFFLDLYPNDRDSYPSEDYYLKNLYSNMLPVHTFIKLKYANDQLELTAFDLEKLNKLFESNLIRLRHENVDGTILITAQPKEIQKFIDRYSDDESVFEDTEIYKRAS